MQIRLGQLKVFPFVSMMLFALYASMDFNAIDMQVVSYAMLALMLLGAVVALYFITLQRTISRTDLLSLAFMAIVTSSSFFHGTDGIHFVYVALSVCFLRFFFNFYQKGLVPLLVGLAIGFSIATFAQIFQLIIQPDLWILPDKKEVTGYIMGGNYNQVGICLLVTILLDLLCIRISRWFYLLLIPCGVICVAIPLMVGSMTAVTAIILFMVICMIPSKHLRRILIMVVFISVFLFQILVCFNGKGIENSDLMVWFIEDVLQKDITFTNRTHMWDSALRVIVESPLWGYGYPDKEWYLNNMSSFAIGPHNILLATLIYGGVFAFVIYICLVGYAIIQVWRVQNYWADCIGAGLAVVSMMSLMEVYSISILFTIIVLAEYHHQLFKPSTRQDE